MIVGLAVALGLAYGGVCAFMYTQQRTLQYRPNAEPMMAPAASGLARVTSETVTTPDGERIVVWWAPPADDARPVFLYLHGNGANLVARIARFERLLSDGSGLMAVSWRGYGGSTGSPTEAGLLGDARAAHAALVRRVDPTRVIIFGESLGTTVSVMLGREARAAGMILDSSFTSATDVASAAYPWLPVRLLLRDQYRADLAAPAVEMPTLQIHCRHDPVTPLATAERLHRLFPNRHPMVVVDEACHPVNFTRYEQALRAFASGALARAGVER